MEDVQSYKCPNCGSALVFSPELNKLHCNACGSDFDLDFEEKQAGEESRPVFSWEQYKKSYDAEQEKIAGAKVYVCKSCGAEITADAVTAATHCPYCDNEVILEDRIEGALRPNGIIPFKLSSKDMIERVKAEAKGKLLLPKDFFSEQKLSKVQGIYVPFWAFDSHIAGTAQLEGSNTHEYMDADFIYTETKYYRIQLDGEMSFENVPVDASVKMDNTLMDSVGPYDFSELEDFDERYLSGYLADRFDDDADASFPRAVSRMMYTMKSNFLGLSYGYGSVNYQGDNFKVRSANVKYVLLPVYLFNLEYKGKKYRFAVNGQSGKMIGELPVSKLKANLWFIGSCIAGAVLFFGAYALAIM